MNKDYQLIQLYCTICHLYYNKLVADAQRTSNNFLPKFTDEECLTIILWGLVNRKFTCIDVYEFIKSYYNDWFPDMPNYKAFNKRVCYLADAIKTMASELLIQLTGDPDCPTHLIDSMPIVVAKASRSGHAKVAPELCDKGYCDSKKMWYYGVKIHTLGQSQYKTLPLPRQMLLTTASVHDLKAAVEILDDSYGIEVFADKAYIKSEWQEDLFNINHVEVITPIKLEKGQEHLNSADSLFSTAVSKVRQPIESFFNWIHELTNIQNASKVRSANGLISFVFARISLACLLLAGVISI
jgi:hypothetical protein